ncbi:formylglycine-generating enzyme family protein [candidate division KSB1 bacterium]|nr:formylglycine-generating enzyme family protein [bacterium]NUM67660.1 formylglycine-generating enzyme family protein [candidate division KSB1 bacterium]
MRASNQLEARTAPHGSKKFQPSALGHGVKPPAASPAEPARSETSVQINKPPRSQRNKIFLAALGLAATFIIGRLLWQTIPQAAYPDPSKFEPVEQKSPEAPEGMVFIPAGSFMMGSEDGDSGEKPVHEVYIDAFYLDQHEVTVAKFREFVNIAGYKTEAEKDEGSLIYTGSSWEMKAGINWRHDAKGQPAKDDHPVIHVSWNDATAYARWAKRRLPTEAEWEYAARSGSKGYKYAWGNSSPVGRNGGNIGDENAKRVFGSSEIWEGFDDGFAYTAPVGSFAPNEFKLYDMTGNVWEWCSSLYKPYPYKSDDGRENLNTLEWRVLRGGSWYFDPRNVRCASRIGGKPTNHDNQVGFRCAQDAR